MTADVPAGRNAAGPPVPTADPAGGDPAPIISIAAGGGWACGCGAYRNEYFEPCPRCGR